MDSEIMTGVLFKYIKLARRLRSLSRKTTQPFDC